MKKKITMVAIILTLLAGGLYLYLQPIRQLVYDQVTSNMFIAVDNDAYGIPHPVTIIIDPQGKVVGTLFLEAYSVRVDALSALGYAQEALGIAGQ